MLHQYHHKISKSLTLTTIVIAVIGSVVVVGSGITSSNNVSAAFATDFQVNISTMLDISIPNEANIDINSNNLNTLVTSDIDVDVSTNNATGYTLAMSSDSTDLVSDTTVNDTTPTIPTLTSTISDLSTFTINHWGISLDNGTTYIPFPSTSYSFDPTDLPVLHDITTIKTGVKLDITQPAGEYSNVIKFEVVANAIPETRTLADIEYMQDINPEICLNTETATSTTGTYVLKDGRDDKQYTVAKLLDGNCWMTQNLALGSYEATTLTPEDSDVSEEWVLPASTDPNEWIYSGHDEEDANIPEFYAYSEDNDDSETKYGNYYNWIAATADSFDKFDALKAFGEVAYSGEYGMEELAGMAMRDNLIIESDLYILSRGIEHMGITDEETILQAYHDYLWSSNYAKSSICPKGWRLPAAGDTMFDGVGLSKPANQFIPLLNTYGMVTPNPNEGWEYASYLDPLVAVDLPFSLVFSGGIFNHDNAGYWWSSMRFSGWDSYILYADNNGVIFAGDNGDSAHPIGEGLSVRCVAR